jgi:hypothetical protein
MENAPEMAYVVERKKADGATRFLACYRDPEGRVRSAGTHATRRAAERAAHREEQKVLAGSWRDTSLGTVVFHDYVQQVVLKHPSSKHHETRSSAESRTQRSHERTIKRPHRQLSWVEARNLGVRAGRCHECSRPGP